MARGAIVYKLKKVQNWYPVVVSEGKKTISPQNQPHKHCKIQQSGTAQVGPISMAQKEQKDFKVSSILFYSTRMRKKFQKIFSIFFLPFFGPRAVE